MPNEKMQQVIDSQQKQLDIQQGELKAQQKQLDQQSHLLEQVQKQLQALVPEPEPEAAQVGIDKTPSTPAKDSSDKPATVAATTQFDQTVPSTQEDQVTPKQTHGIAFGRNQNSHPSFHINYDFNELDQFPTDISKDKGIFIASDDGKKLFRLYGSLRTRMVLEDRDNLQPWNQDMTSLLTGANDVRQTRTVFSTNESRMGLDLSIRDLLSMRAEFDLRGLDSPLRIRHMYIRNRNWVVGKNWTAFNTITLAPLSLDYHSTGAAVGIRTNQIKYTNGSNNWFYQVAVEDHQPSIVAPDDINATAQNTIPHFVGHIERRQSWGEVRVAAMLSPNRVQYTGGTQNELGWSLMAGVKAQLNEKNVFIAHAMTISGQNTRAGDFGDIGEYDMVYDPATDNFDNLRSIGGQFGLEHYWTPVLSTTIGGGYLHLNTKSYQDPLFFNQGYKGLINLIWRPLGPLDGVTMGIEYEQVGRKNLDKSKNKTNRVNVVLWYDF